jgi:hypothetical protein
MAALRSGSKPEIKEELRAAAYACAQPFDGDTEEDERREVLESVVNRLQRELAAGDSMSCESRTLAGCVILLEHLQVKRPRHYVAAAACRHRAAIY